MTESLVVVGASWCGTLESLYAVHHGRSESILGIELMSAEEGASLVGHTQTAYDLFPLPELLLVHDMRGNAADANVDLSWLKPGRDYAWPLAASAHARLGARDGSAPDADRSRWPADRTRPPMIDCRVVHAPPPERT